MFQIEEVKLQLSPILDFICRIPIVDLGPTGDSGSNEVTERVERDGLHELIDELTLLGARSHNTHFALDDIPELWDFIEAALPEDASDAGHAAIPLVREGRRIAFMFHHHRAEFADAKRMVVKTHAVLPKEDGPAGVQFDGDGADPRQQQKQRKEQQADAPVEGAFDHRHASGGPYADQMALIDPFWLHAAGERFIDHLGIEYRGVTESTFGEKPRPLGGYFRCHIGHNGADRRRIAVRLIDRGPLDSGDLPQRLHAPRLHQSPSQWTGHPHPQPVPEHDPYQ